MPVADMSMSGMKIDMEGTRSAASCTTHNPRTSDIVTTADPPESSNLIRGVEMCEAEANALVEGVHLIGCL